MEVGRVVARHHDQNYDEHIVVPEPCSEVMPPEVQEKRQTDEALRELFKDNASCIKPGNLTSTG